MFGEWAIENTKTRILKAGQINNKNMDRLFILCVHMEMG